MPATLLEESGLAEAAHNNARDIVTPMSQQSRRSPDHVQEMWATWPIAARLRVLRRARHLFAEQTNALCSCIPAELARTPADTLCAEVLPLLAAFKFLERDAETILRPRRIGWRGRPLWLTGVSSEVHRVPMGRVLMIAPSNYPLFLPGVQVIQALAAGNLAIWKPAPGGREVALLFADTMRRAGLPDGLLKVTEDSIAAAQDEIARGVDKVFFTGSASSGRMLLKQLADTLTPCVAELSGCDAVFVLPSADITRVVKALTFGMRLNGSATCMAPRRIILVGATQERRDKLVLSLSSALEGVKGIPSPHRTQQHLLTLIEDATASGAHLHGRLNDSQQPMLVTAVTPTMLIAKADIFAPLLTLMEAVDMEQAVAFNRLCPYALTAAIFGDKSDALGMAAKIIAGTVIINDLMVPAADPRTPFGGRHSSGFGTTQGPEGLLEMTAPKTISVKRGSNTNHYNATTAVHEALFQGIIRASHGTAWRDRIGAFKRIAIAATHLSKKT